MARCLRVLTTTVALMVAIAAGSASATVYRACLQASSGGKTWYYEIRTDQANQAQGTTLDRWIVNGATSYVDRNRYAAFHEPAAGTTTWDEGVAFAATMQTRNAWLNTEQTKAASWVNDPAGGGVTWTFKTTVNGAPQDYIFRTSQCHDVQQPDTDAPTDPQEPDTDAPAVACKGYGGYGDLECSGGDTCCGAGGMSPHCVASDNGDKCCTWFLSSATCSATQSCCGELGVGASSHAFCCNAGTECCQAQVGYSGVATCCPAGTKCCRGSTVGLCCAMDEECDASFNRCKKASGTDAPTDPQEPDTPAPAPASTVHACLQASSGGKTYYYEIFSDPSDDAKGTTFDRYTVAGGVDTFVDSNTFAALRAAPGGAPWAQGIQFADAMQSRGVWINVEPTTAASIAHASGEDTLIFKTTVNGGPQDYIFKSSQCR